MKQKFDKSNPEHHSPFNLFSKQQKIHPAIEYFRQLQGQPSTLQLERFLSSFAEPKLINYENFVEGVKRFIELANSNPIGKEINRKTSSSKCAVHKLTRHSEPFFFMTRSTG